MLRLLCLMFAGLLLTTAFVMFGFAPMIAVAAYTAIGISLAQRANKTMLLRSGFDVEYRMMQKDLMRHSAAMLLPMLALVMFWPLALIVVFAFIQPGRSPNAA